MAPPTTLEFGVNLNNREPLIAPGYGIPQLLDLSETVEGLGFDSVWVGDSLFSKPRYESMALLSALSQRTKRVKLGTACIVTSPRNPLYLALEWATLDVLSGGRTIFGPCAGNPEHGVRREFEALGLDFDKRFSIFEEGLEIVRQLWTDGTVTHHGAQYDYTDISFFSGTEMGPLMPIQQPPPFWIVSNPRLVTDAADEKMVRTMKTACRRILKYGDGWMTCCRAQHPEELEEQLGYLREVAAETGDDASRLTVSLPGDAQHRGLGGRRPEGVRRLHRPVLPGAVQGDPTSTTGDRSVRPTRSSRGSGRSLPRGSTISSAASARSTSSGRWSGSRGRCCRHSVEELAVTGR